MSHRHLVFLNSDFKKEQRVRFNRTRSTLAVVVNGLLVLTAPERATAQSTYDDIWKLAEWYHNDQNEAVQSVLFSGRFQYEFAAVDADQGTHDEWNVRRMRLGVKSELFSSVHRARRGRASILRNEPRSTRGSQMFMLNGRRVISSR